MGKTTRPPDARERILDTAGRLFYRDGIRAVGVDTVIAEAGVAKMTLYHHFKSKDALVLAYLERRDRQWRDWFERELARRPGSPRDRVLLVFDLLGEWFRTADFRGCAFINAAAELADAGHPGRQAVRAHKRDLADSLRRLGREAGARDPEALAAQLMLLVEGAIMTAVIAPESRPAARASEAARILVDGQIPGRNG